MTIRNQIFPLKRNSSGILVDNKGLPFFHPKANQILNDLSNTEGSIYFCEPVDPIQLNLPTYLDIIKKPMDISTIQNKLNKNEYPTFRSFESDCLLMFNNALKFNPSQTHVYMVAAELKKNFEILYKKHLRNYQKIFLNAEKKQKEFEFKKNQLELAKKREREREKLKKKLKLEEKRKSKKKKSYKRERERERERERDLEQEREKSKKQKKGSDYYSKGGNRSKKHHSRDRFSEKEKLRRSNKREKLRDNRNSNFDTNSFNSKKKNSPFENKKKSSKRKKKRRQRKYEHSINEQKKPNLSDGLNKNTPQMNNFPKSKIKVNEKEHDFLSRNKKMSLYKPTKEQTIKNSQTKFSEKKIDQQKKKEEELKSKKNKQNFLLEKKKKLNLKDLPNAVSTESEDELDFNQEIETFSVLEHFKEIKHLIKNAKNSKPGSQDYFENLTTCFNLIKELQNTLTMLTFEILPFPIAFLELSNSVNMKIPDYQFQELMNNLEKDFKENINSRKRSREDNSKFEIENLEENGNERGVMEDNGQGGGEGEKANEKEMVVGMDIEKNKEQVGMNIEKNNGHLNNVNNGNDKDQVIEKKITEKEFSRLVKKIHRLSQEQKQNVTDFLLDIVPNIKSERIAKVDFNMMSNQQLLKIRKLVTLLIKKKSKIQIENNKKMEDNLKQLNTNSKIN
ncbi:transcription factor gte11 [Anaeramoeba flamelloides]|uniref:Transcription factor gte11 n=1 Tax=Anaeramoeba flamelloides TaxID=1746091 RepID=A0AAV7ZKY3_9EUKA|nr:transcription factor gte11 [Anaeramoeba flamelloides]